MAGDRQNPVSSLTILNNAPCACVKVQYWGGGVFPQLSVSNYLEEAGFAVAGQHRCLSEIQCICDIVCQHLWVLFYQLVLRINDSLPRDVHFIIYI